MISKKWKKYLLDHVLEVDELKVSVATNQALVQKYMADKAKADAEAAKDMAYITRLKKFNAKAEFRRLHGVSPPRETEEVLMRFFYCVVSILFPRIISNNYVNKQKSTGG